MGLLDLFSLSAGGLSGSREDIRVLFICKKNMMYSFVSYCRRSSGLFNSTRFIVESLVARGITAEIVEVGDNNDIDRECARFKPTVVVIEALWVVPEKYEVLMKLYPDVQWLVHLHSNIPFLQLEGIAMDWIMRAADMGVRHIANSTESFDALSVIIPGNLIYLPNVYNGEPQDPVKYDKLAPILNVGCFGAIRPMKNQLTQALAAIQCARKLKKHLRFHINASRVETGGNPVLKNLQQLFELVDNAELVQHAWFEPDEFITFLHDEIDVGMQVSMTETFNVVTADYVTAGVPIVVSKEVMWAAEQNKVIEDHVTEMSDIMAKVLGQKFLITKNQTLLDKFSKAAQKLWFDWARSTQKQ